MSHLLEIALIWEWLHYRLAIASSRSKLIAIMSALEMVY
jgi:hypothetical protein